MFKTFTPKCVDIKNVSGFTINFKSCFMRNILHNGILIYVIRVLGCYFDINCNGIFNLTFPDWNK